VHRSRPLAGVPEPITVRAPAKINLALRVEGRRPDGYHELTTVFQAVSLVDELTVSPAQGLGMTVSGEGAAELPTDGSNLALAAARLLAERGAVRGGAHLELRKGIPVAGGLAGGSADAAAALVACDALWDTGFDREALAALAAELGSDVPFALRGGTALGTGRGEQLAPVLARGTYHWVLAFADGGLSTPEVYRAFDEGGHPASAAPDEVLAALRAGDAAALGRALSNDLQPAALRLRPGLQRVLDAGADLGALAGIVSGSGPTVALLAPDGRRATELAARLAGTGLCRAVRRAHGPAAGARLVETPGTGPRRFTRPRPSGG
jgi:4-diphosphocytidyl-2-C-methyl-D-erythritol kinase